MIGQFDFKDENSYKLIDAIGASIYWKDKDGHILGCNSYMLKMAGVKSRTEIIGKTDYELCWKNYADGIRAADISAMKAGSYTGEECVMSQMGEERTYFSTKTQLRDAKGNVIGIAGVSFDITEQKKSIEQEKQQVVDNEQIKIMQIIDVVNASIYWKDKGGHILGCNKYMVDMFGANDRAELIGKTDYDLYPPEIARKISEMDVLVMKDGAYENEEKAILNDKKHIYLSAKNRLLNIQGKVIGIVGTSIDITAQKETEQLKIKNIKLESENKLNQTILEKTAAEAETERLRLENEIHKLENESYLAEKKSQENFIKFIDKIQSEIQNYRLKALTERLGIKTQATTSDKSLHLTKRELDVLYYLSLNKSPKDIAKIITIIEGKAVSDSTINAIINKKLYPKFEVFNIGQLVEKAIMLNLIPFLLEK